MLTKLIPTSILARSDSEMLNTGDTIAAIATAIVPEQGSIGIVRLSGSQAVAIARRLFHTRNRQKWQSHRLLYGYIRHPQSQAIIDEALLLLMLAPRSVMAALCPYNRCYSYV
jgi:tRNA modification GTPase